jgi:hypothetical protein
MISSTIGGALQALGIGGLLSTGGIIAGLKNVADLGGEISDVSARTGIAADQLVILREQFRQGGIEAGTVTQYIRRMNEALMDGKKQNLFKALGLDAQRLLSGGPVNALNAIINSVRELNSTAAQQGVLSKIFGGRQGVQLMTLVVDEDSANKAKQMVGGLAGVIKKNMDDFDTISDNSAEGLKIKLQQAFAGFLESVKGPLLKLTDLITRADFTQTGQSLGQWLMWAWNMFRQLVSNGDIWRVAILQLQRGFLSSVAILATALQAAWNSLFSSRNIQALGAFVAGLGKVIGTSIAESLPTMLGGGINANRTAIREAGMTQMGTAFINAPAFAMKSIQDFATELGNWRADTAFAPILQKMDEELAARLYMNAAFAGLSPTAPAIVGPTMQPGSTSALANGQSIFNQGDTKQARANENKILELLGNIANHTGATADEVADLAFE